MTLLTFVSDLASSGRRKGGGGGKTASNAAPPHLSRQLSPETHRVGMFFLFLPLNSSTREPRGGHAPTHALVLFSLNRFTASAQHVGVGVCQLRKDWHFSFSPPLLACRWVLRLFSMPDCFSSCQEADKHFRRICHSHLASPPRPPTPTFNEVIGSRSRH